MLLAVANNNGCRFGHHCCRRASPISIKHRGQHKYINFYINFLSLLELFEGGLEKGIRKAARPLDDMDSSNPHRRRGWQLHHHGGGVCGVLVFCAAVSTSHCHSVYVKKSNLALIRLTVSFCGPPRLAPHLTGS